MSQNTIGFFLNKLQFNAVSFKAVQIFIWMRRVGHYQISDFTLFFIRMTNGVPMSGEVENKSVFRMAAILVEKAHKNLFKLLPGLILFQCHFESMFFQCVGNFRGIINRILQFTPLRGSVIIIADHQRIRIFEKFSRKGAKMQR